MTNDPGAPGTNEIRMTNDRNMHEKTLRRCVDQDFRSSFVFRHSFVPGAPGSFVIRHSLALLILTVPAWAEQVTYQDHVRPILREHCFACHNQDEAKSGLVLDSFVGLTTGGASGEVVSAGDPDASRLWKLVTHQEEPNMPPGDKLPEEKLQVLRAWIEGGLLKDAGSKPLKSSKPAIAKLDAAKLGQPVGDPAMPEQLFHEPVLWTPRAGPVDAIATSPWAPLAAVAWQRQISFYDTNTHELLGIIPYVDGVPHVVRFSLDGSLVLVAGGRHAAAGSAALFDVKTGARLATLGDELDIVLAADISPDLSLIAIGGPKKKVRVYRVADGELAYQISKHTDWITAVSFSPDGSLLATADRNGGALLWQAAAGHERADLRGHKGTVTSLDWRTDGAMLATASEDGTMRLWNPAGQQVKSIEAHKSGVLSVRYSKAGNLVTAGRDQKVKTWKSDGAAIADLGQLPGLALAAAFTHDGAKVITSDYTGEVRVYDATSKEHLATLQANPPSLAQRFAEAEKVLRQAQQKFQRSENQLKAQLASLEQSKAAHVAYEEKLAVAQNAMNAERKHFDELAKLLADSQQKFIATRQPAEQAAASLAEAQKAQAATTEKAEAEATVDSEQLAEVKQQLEAAEAAHATAKQQAQQAEEGLNAAAVKHQAAEKSVQSAEATLMQVTGETAGLPDLAKPTEQHELAKAEAADAEELLGQAEHSKTQIAAQQARFAHATEQLASEVQERRNELQDLAKQSGRLEAEHQQATSQLASHLSQQAEIAKQLKAIQAKLAELESAGMRLQEQKSKSAKELAKIQTALADSQQQVERLETSKRDFVAADALRKAYAASAENSR